MIKTEALNQMNIKNEEKAKLLIFFNKNWVFHWKKGKYFGKNFIRSLYVSYKIIEEKYFIFWNKKMIIKKMHDFGKIKKKEYNNKCSLPELDDNIYYFF